MAKKLTSVLGIDIGSRKIKVAEIKTQNREPVVSALAMIDTPEGAVDHTGVYNAEAVGLALKQSLTQSGATTAFSVVSIAGQASVLVRTLEVPRMSETELKEHMQWEINRNIPFAESNVLSDFKALEDEDPNSQNMEVVMAISPQSAIDTIVACVKKAGKQMGAIDVQALALARSIKYSYDSDYRDLTVCLVDVGHKTTSINLYKNGRLLMPRQVPVGGEMFTKAIADASGVGPEEAEQLKQERAHVHVGLLQSGGADSFGFGDAGGMTQEFQPYNPFSDEPAAAPGEGEAMAPEASDHVEPEPPPPHEEGATPSYDPFAHAADPHSGAPHSEPAPKFDPETERINNAIAPVLEEFVAEIRRSLDYFRSRGGTIERVAICGGASKLTGLAETLGSSLGIQCDSYDPLSRLNISGKKLDPQFVDEHRPDFAVAVGNALHIYYE